MSTRMTPVEAAAWDRFCREWVDAKRWAPPSSTVAFLAGYEAGLERASYEQEQASLARRAAQAEVPR